MPDASLDPPTVPSVGAARTTRRAPYDVLVVGAGFAGSIMAEQAASRGLRVLVIDRRPHIAGNAYDELDEHGVLVHRYGPHIFHTNAPSVSGYLSRFTDWLPYEHRVLAQVGEQLVPVPINRTTINRLYGLELDADEQVQAYLSSVAEPRARMESSEDAVVGKVGRDLYERLFRGYTRKQWALDPSQLDASVCARIPVRTNTDDRYFTDSFQFMPRDGYTAMFARMLDHRLIETRVGVGFDEVAERVRYRLLVWTGPIDAYFGHELGVLPYRSLTFRTETRPVPEGGYLQPVGQVNYPSEDVPYTRVTEFRHLTGQREARMSTVAYEFPCAEGDPYYPVPRPENRELYKRYERLAAGERDVVFVGRLARYQYLNMDQVTAQALLAAREAFNPEPVPGRRARLAPAPALPAGARPDSLEERIADAA
ncbi:MAG TPA: UDP-galactopyranose mutase [Solirubrobacteraceae bacterium]|nr:UDP-galactopyranose mutase [Solirubrobacteraceae bacterium]